MTTNGEDYTMFAVILTTPDTRRMIELSRHEVKERAENHLLFESNYWDIKLLSVMEVAS
jgi:hypothetical protein